MSAILSMVLLYSSVSTGEVVRRMLRALLNPARALVCVGWRPGLHRVIREVRQGVGGEVFISGGRLLS